MATENPVHHLWLCPEDQAIYEGRLGGATLSELRLASRLQNLAQAQRSKLSCASVDPAPVYLAIAVAMLRDEKEREAVIDLLSGKGE
jgi:hypothetical protein